MPASTHPDFVAENESALLEELIVFKRGLCGAAPLGCAEPDGPLTAVFRLLPGLPPEKVVEFIERHGLAQWLTMPIDADAYPLLRRLQNLLETLSFQTEHDPLTGLANRRAFERVLDLEMERSRRSRTPVSLAVIDLDDFKKINDTYGHPAGDEVLIRVAQAMDAAKRRYDLAARIGGEEFALVLSGVGVLKAENMLARLADMLREHVFEVSGGRTFRVTCSIGLAGYKGLKDKTTEELFRLADTALYQAKREGKDRIVCAPVLEDEASLQDTLVHSNEKRFLFTGA